MGNAARKKILLVVDDDSATLTSLSDVLEADGHTVISATHGRDALDYLRGMPPPDLAVIDLMMPVMDGWALATEIRQDPRLASTPVVIISAGGEKALARAPVAAGYLSKPLDLEQLLQVVRRGLSLRPERSEDTLRLFRDLTSHKVSSRRIAVPIALAIGCSPRFEKEHRDTACYAGAVLRMATAGQALSKIDALRPVAVLLAQEVVPERRLEIERSAEAAGARVILLEHDEKVEPLQLEARVRAAVQSSGRF